MILYTDPADVNKVFDERGQEKTYPYSWWMPSSGVQRGTLFTEGEDPDTPFYPATGKILYYVYLKQNVIESTSHI